MATKKDRAVPLPNKLWIGTFEVPVKVVPAGDGALMDEDGKSSNGMSIVHDEDLCGIWIQTNLAPRKRLEIVLHETTHVINWVYDLDDDELPIIEEAIAEAHGKAWTQLYLDNPRFLKWLVYITDKIRRDQKASTDADAKESEAHDHPRHAGEAGGSPVAPPLGGPVCGPEET